MQCITHVHVPSYDWVDPKYVSILDINLERQTLDLLVLRDSQNEPWLVKMNIQTILDRRFEHLIFFTTFYSLWLCNHSYIKILAKVTVKNGYVRLR